MCFAIFDLISSYALADKLMCFSSTFSYPHKEFLIQRPARTRSKYNPLTPRGKCSPTRTRTHSSADSRTRPANAGTRNPRRSTRPAQDSTTNVVSAVFHLNNKKAKHEVKFNHNNKPLPFCSKLKYLGVTLNRRNSWLEKFLTSRHVGRTVIFYTSNALRKLRIWYEDLMFS